MRNEKNKEFFKTLINKYDQGLDQFSSFKVNAENEDKSYEINKTFKFYLKFYRKYQFWNKRELSAREDEDYFTEEDEDDIFKDDAIIKNLEAQNLKYEEEINKISDSLEISKEKNNEEIDIINTSTQRDIEFNNGNNINLIKEISDNFNKDNNLLKRKVLYEEEKNEKIVNLF